MLGMLAAKDTVGAWIEHERSVPIVHLPACVMKSIAMLTSRMQHAATLASARFGLIDEWH